MKTPMTATCGDIDRRYIRWKANCVMCSACKESNMLCIVLTKLQTRNGHAVYIWLCALTCECRGSFVTSQRLLYGHCCPPQMTLAASQGISVSSAALHGRSVRCNCAWSDTRPRPHYSWTVAAVSQEYWNVRCLLRRYVHTNINRRRLLRYYDQLRRWMRCSFLRDCGTGLPVCTLRVLVCSGSHRGYQLWYQHCEK